MIHIRALPEDWWRPSVVPRGYARTHGMHKRNIVLSSGVGRMTKDCSSRKEHSQYIKPWNHHSIYVMELLNKVVKRR